MKTTWFICCVALLLQFIEPIAVAEDSPLPLETAVKVFRSSVPTEPAPQMRTIARPVPSLTTPAAKYPQYQLGHQPDDRPKVEDVTNPSIRFFLNLPTETLLVEARITIDDLPFGMIRQKRVEQILKDVTVAKKSEPIPQKHADDQPPAPDLPSTDPPTESYIVDRLRHTMELTGETPVAAEVDWLISQWIDGPTILPLNSNFQRFRANQRPELVILDRNRDGTISAEELQLAETSLWECDLNQDGIIQFMEIAVAATAARSNQSPVESGDLVVFVPTDDTASEAFRRLAPVRHVATDGTPVPACRFDTNANGKLDPNELDVIRQSVPDLSLTIAFNSNIPEKSRIALTAAAEQFSPSTNQVGVDPTEITLTLRGAPVILSAVQMHPSDQISIGAVNDGYPMLPFLDPNDDGRLTLRELRGLKDALNGFDRNHDGSLTMDEVRSPIRLCFGLGANVHRELLGIRKLYRKVLTPKITGPEWFNRMDRNRDNDLTRLEFPGTDEQFEALDADHDALISADEALRFDETSENGKQDDAEQPAANPGAASSTDSIPSEGTKP